MRKYVISLLVGLTMAVSSCSSQNVAATSNAIQLANTVNQISQTNPGLVQAASSAMGTVNTALQTAQTAGAISQVAGALTGGGSMASLSSIASAVSGQNTLSNNHWLTLANILTSSGALNSPTAGGLGSVANSLLAGKRQGQFASELTPQFASSLFALHDLNDDTNLVANELSAFQNTIGSIYDLNNTNVGGMSLGQLIGIGNNLVKY